MAGENLTVVHRKTPTAYFDLKNRLLCCPIFKDDISPELYDLFMGHEVGHALWTHLKVFILQLLRTKLSKDISMLLRMSGLRETSETSMD